MKMKYLIFCVIILLTLPRLTETVTRRVRGRTRDMLDSDDLKLLGEGLQVEDERKHALKRPLNQVEARYSKPNTEDIQACAEEDISLEGYQVCMCVRGIEGPTVRCSFYEKKRKCQVHVLHHETGHSRYKKTLFDGAFRTDGANFTCMCADGDYYCGRRERNFDDDGQERKVAWKPKEGTYFTMKPKFNQRYKQYMAYNIHMVVWPYFKDHPDSVPEDYDPMNTPSRISNYKRDAKILSDADRKEIKGKKKPTKSPEKACYKGTTPISTGEEVRVKGKMCKCADGEWQCPDPGLVKQLAPDHSWTKTGTPGPGETLLSPSGFNPAPKAKKPKKRKGPPTTLPPPPASATRRRFPAVKTTLPPVINKIPRVRTTLPGRRVIRTTLPGRGRRSLSSCNVLSKTIASGETVNIAMGRCTCNRGRLRCAGFSRRK